MKKIALLFALLIGAEMVTAQNQNITSSFYPDTEPYIAVNPVNSNNLIAAWMRVNLNLTVNIAVAYSNNGGVNWSVPVSMPHLYSSFTSADVSIAFNKTGTAYMSYVDFHPSKDSGYVVVTSTINGGSTWSGLTKVISGSEKPDLPIDRPWIVVDKSSGTYSGRIYITSKSVDIGTLPHHVWMKSSSNGGLTWSPITIIDDSIPTNLITTSMGAIDIGADGSVNIGYASWNPSQNVKPRVIMVKSTDGGTTFTPYFVAYPANNSAITDTLYQASFVLAANPSNSNNIVISVVDQRNGDPDILSLYSINGGVSWNATPIRVNDDATSNGVGQDMCWAGFTPSGTYSVVWRDRRNSGTTSSSNFEIYAAASVDGGKTFKTNYRISDTPSPAIPITKGNDFIGVALTNSFLFTNWCDKRLTNNYEIFVNRDSVSKVISSVKELKKTEPSIACFPNPTTSSITFSFDLNTASHTIITIYDILGSKIESLEGNDLRQGPNNLVYDTRNLTKGNYIIEISGNGFASRALFTKSGDQR